MAETPNAMISYSISVWTKVTLRMRVLCHGLRNRGNVNGGHAPARRVCDSHIRIQQSHLRQGNQDADVEQGLDNGAATYPHHCKSIMPQISAGEHNPRLSHGEERSDVSIPCLRRWRRIAAPTDFVGMTHNNAFTLSPKTIGLSSVRFWRTELNHGAWV